MTKAGIINEISKKTGMEKAAVAVIVEAFMKSVKDSMLSGENVYLRGFGSFVVKRRAEKLGRNITAKTSVTIPAHYFPTYKPSKEFGVKVKQTVKKVKPGYDAGFRHRDKA